MTTVCEIWEGLRNKNGYGLVYVSSGVHKLAHRVAWERVNGPIPKGMCVCHKCDIPSCVNVDHLFLGTQSENMKDMWAKGRARPVPNPAPKGEKNYGAKLTERAVLSIREDKRVQTEIAREYGISQQTVSDIKRLRRWGWLLRP